jgi:hypothetical protein
MTLKQYLDEGKTYSDEGCFAYPVYLVKFSGNGFLIAFKGKILIPSGRPTRSGSERVPGPSPLPEASARGGMIEKERFRRRFNSRRR